MEAQNVKRGHFPVTIQGRDVRRYVITKVDQSEYGWVWLRLRSPIGGYPDLSFRLTPTEEIEVLL